mgnify:CR=1 FL=1|jgi:hypothetical protein
MTHIRLLVDKSDLSRAELRTLEDAPLSAGQVRVAVQRFALTANNITYAAFGDAMHYWDFFPTPDPAWGVVPVWGFGDVVQSLHPGVAVGERLYGYFPMGDQLVLQPQHLSPSGFSDSAPHRAALHGVYNQYLRCDTDPMYSRETEDLQALLRPLFTTSWLIDDFLADNAFFGCAGDAAHPGVMLLSSASSKTAYGTAFMLAQRTGIRVVGLTSPANLAFCESLGCYQQVLGYEALDTLAADTPCIYIDFAGNAGLRSAVHHRFAQLAYSCAIGGTHVEQLGGARDLPGPKASLFFAPAQIKKRRTEWGAQVLAERLLQAWQSFLTRVSDPQSPWLEVQQHRGPAALQAVYQAVLAGRSDPRTGHMVRPRAMDSHN